MIIVEFLFPTRNTKVGNTEKKRHFELGGQ